MLSCGIPELSDLDDLKYVYDALRPHESEADATMYFTRLIESSLGSVATKLNFFIHNLAQMKFATSEDRPSLSFAPRVHTARSDGIIKNLYISKHIPTAHKGYVSTELFPSRFVIGRSRSEATAERRKDELNGYVWHLTHAAPEVAQLVYDRIPRGDLNQRVIHLRVLSDGAFWENTLLGETFISLTKLVPVGFESQESSWIGLLSRPALSLLRKFRLWSAAPAEIGKSFISEESEIIRQLNEIMPLTSAAAHHFTYMRCQHDGAAGLGLLEPGTSGSGPWLTAVSVRNVGMESPGEMALHQQPHIGYFSSARALINQVLINSQEVQPAEGKARVSVRPLIRNGSAGKVGARWSSFMRMEDGSEMLSEVMETDQFCPTSAAQTKAPPAETTHLLESMLRENTGPPQLANNGGPHRVQNTQGFMEDQLGCREVGRPSAEQDNGYSSLEEELSQRCLLSQLRAPSEELNQNIPQMEEMQEEQPEPEEVLSAPQCQNRNIAFIMGCRCSDDDSSQSEPESDGDDENDDDGFDSKGSSDLSNSSDEDEDDEASDSDTEPDLESDRLWSSLCQSLDPYNPRNFTALLHTGRTPASRTTSTLPWNAPATSSSLLSSPAASSPPISTSPPSDQDTWDDSTSASEADEAESLRLLSSFSCSSDPYSPLNFKAPLRTRGPTGPTSKHRNRTDTTAHTPPQTLQHNTACSPEYRKEEAEERLDSGFSEASTSARSCKINKKVSSAHHLTSCHPTPPTLTHCTVEVLLLFRRYTVAVKSRHVQTSAGSSFVFMQLASRKAESVRFCDDVEEFFASCGEEEDRRGPWEELARDRCRFLRRCQEVEQSIGFCLQPQHRCQVLQRLTALCDT
ncbi:hypothetical protein GOODEAATRI_020057 [Goodea atripinnis]|uniref:Protein phosphatase 1 regulatory subunit 15A/B C-terminal domain-containing protein n=1 Tax=Goodea atripinnis TaxID=208336 RepID=A0ABV0PZI7_9TELE